MDTQIKKYADSRNLKELKYIFVDALDVDPTFVRYEEEYNYCRSVSGLLEPHVELTPFILDKSRWDEAYWTSLKMDLIKNFSDRRMSHMREVAKVFLAEKVERILLERTAASNGQNAPAAAPSSAPAATIVPIPERKAEPTARSNQISKAEQERRELEEARRKLEEDNRKAEAAQKADAERIKRQQQMYQSSAQNRSTGDFSKKAVGIAVAALIVAAVVLILVLK